MSGWASGAVAAPGGVLGYHRTGGSGPPLLLSHGLTDNGLCWSRLAHALAPEFDVVMLDARGHGASSPMPAGGSHDPGGDIAAAVAALELPAPLTVIGHSVGARAAASFASRRPPGLARLILEDPPLLPPMDPSLVESRRGRFREQVARFRTMSISELVAFGKATSLTWSDEEFPAWAEAKHQVDPEAFPAYATAWQAEIARIEVPTLLIHGEPDRGSLVTPAVAAEALACNPRLRTVRIPDAGHNVRRENFDAYLSAVRSFLTATS